jgi:hypothetical protein
MIRAGVLSPQQTDRTPGPFLAIDERGLRAAALEIARTAPRYRLHEIVEEFPPRIAMLVADCVGRLARGEVQA